MATRGRCLLVILILSVIGCEVDTNDPDGQRQAARVPALRRNFVFILTDDLDWQLIPYLDQVRTHLVQKGATFDHFYVTSSVCCPSRVSYLTGLYAHNHGVLTNGYPLGGYRSFRERGHEGRTIADRLHAAGYRTALIGKLMNGYPLRGEEGYVPPGWSEWYATTDGHYYDFRINENGRIVDYPCCDAYETDVQTLTAVDFIRRAVTEQKPFFLWINPIAPHAPAMPAPRHFGATSSIQVPRKPSFNEADVSDKPDQIATRELMGPGQIAALGARFRRGVASSLAVADMLDSLLATLASTGVLGNTYIFYTSDNGFHWGEHRLGAGKTTAYDEDIRVPLFVRGPGISGGRTVEEIVLNIDIAPTLAALAGVEPPEFVDGRSFAPLLSRSFATPGRWRKGLLVERWDPAGSPRYFSATGYTGLRTLEYLYVEWDTGEYELYDRFNDPFELENIYYSASPELRFHLSTWLNQLSSCSASGCSALEDGFYLSGRDRGVGRLR